MSRFINGIFEKFRRRSSEQKDIEMFYVLTDKLSFEIDKQDLPELYNWKDAMDISINYGDRWRLPTAEELVLMHRLHQ